MGVGDRDLVLMESDLFGLHCPAGTGCFGYYHDDDADCYNNVNVDDADDC